MTRWIKPSVRRPTEPGLYRVEAELDDGTIEEQEAEWSEREGFIRALGLPGTIVGWEETEPTTPATEAWLLETQQDLAREESDAAKAALSRLTLEAHAALDRAGVPESLPYYGPESADYVEQMTHRSPHALGVVERIDELRAERDAARAQRDDTRRALDHLLHNYCRLFGLSMAELVELYRGEGKP